MVHKDYIIESECASMKLVQQIDVHLPSTMKLAAIKPYPHMSRMKLNTTLRAKRFRLHSVVARQQVVGRDAEHGTRDARTSSTF